MRKTREEKAITLIALIITIVVLLILAVVAINAVTGDGIIQYAVNAKTDYKKAQDDEELILQNYLEVLNEKTKPDEETSSKITWTKTSTGGLAVGSTVKTSTNEEFYVIGFKDNYETAILLAKDCIDTTNFVQSANAGTVAFYEGSAPGYWGSGTSPYDIEEHTQPIPNAHKAAYAADRYGVSLGVTGRLMLYSEAEALQSTNSDILYGTNGKSSRTYLNYWLGTAGSTSSVWVAAGDLEGLMCDSFNYGTIWGVRPVVEILKSNIYSTVATI